MYGLDLLGLAHPLFKMKDVIKALPQGWAVGCFDGVFGDVESKLKKLLNSRPDISAVRVQLWWGGAAHRIAPLDLIKRRAPVFERIAKSVSMPVYLSHSCEYNEQSKIEVKKRVDLIRDLAPSCIPVNSVYKGVTLPGVLTERHGSKAYGDLVSTDGENIYDMDAERWLNNTHTAQYQFLWGSRFNLREIYKEDQPIPPPSKRTAAPDHNYIRSVAELGKQKPEAPKPAFTSQAFKAPNIFKTHSEDIVGPGARDNKPVVIIDIKAPELQIVTCTGDVIGKFPYYGVIGSQFRYYSGIPGGPNLYGWQIAEKAQKASGSPYIWLKAKGKTWGPIHPTFRQGVFRG